MPTSGTTEFNLKIDEIIEEAFERCGLQTRKGYDLDTARRSLDIMFSEWANRGLNLWTIQEGTTSVTAGTSRYTLAGDILDVIEAYIRTDSGSTDNQFDQMITRVSVSQYAHLSNKLTQAKPLQYWVEKDPAAISINLWPVPDSVETYTLGYYYMQRIEDSGKPGSNNMDMPSRYLPCLVSGLAYQLSLKRPEVSDRAPSLKADYEEQWNLAADADREKAAFQVTPGGYRF